MRFKLLILISFLGLILSLPTPAVADYCGPAGTARADGLVTTTTPITGNFYTTGKCIINSKTAFTPYKLPTYADLKSVYYTQSKAPGKQTPNNNPNVNISSVTDGYLYNYTNTGIFSSGFTYGTGISVVAAIFVDNSFTINNNITGGTDDGLVIVVGGDINIASTVTRIDAVLIAAGRIYTAGAGCSLLPPGSNPLTVNGSLVALDSSKPIKFCRNLTDNNQPAELINHQPKYLVILRNLYSDTLQKWSEITTPIAVAPPTPPPPTPPPPTPPPPTPPPPTPPPPTPPPPTPPPPTPPPPTPPPGGGDKKVFATSSTTSGIMPDLDGADSKCQAAAASASPSPLSGTWKAWISDSSTDAKNRITDGRYVKVNDSATVVADNKTKLISDNLKSAITWDQNGNTVSGRAWTGTSELGINTGSNCQDWTASSVYTGTYGIIGSSIIDYRWTKGGTAACSGVYKLYCFEQ